MPQSGRRGGAYSLLLGRPPPPFFFWKRPIVKTDVLQCSSRPGNRRTYKIEEVKMTTIAKVLPTRWKARARAIAPTVSRVELRAANRPGRWTHSLVASQFGTADTDAFDTGFAKQLAAAINITGETPSNGFRVGAV